MSGDSRSSGPFATNSKLLNQGLTPISPVGGMSRTVARARGDRGFGFNALQEASQEYGGGQGPAARGVRGSIKFMLILILLRYRFVLLKTRDLWND